MKSKYSLLMLFVCAVLASTSRTGAQTPSSTAPPNVGSISMDKAVDKAIENERLLTKSMANMKPLIETYVQNMEPHPDLGAVPKSDRYFLGKLDLSHGMRQTSLLPESGWISTLGQRVKQVYSVTFLPDGFGAMILLGPNFEKGRYNFTYVRREFLGDVRCLVFDVEPKRASESNVAFVGRIWVEDRDFNIVRFNGTRTPSGGSKLYFHFDSWRENIGPGLWLPAYVYSEESDHPYFMGTRKLRFKAQTRLWAYNVGRANQQNELTSLTVEADNVRDQAPDADSITPIEALRSWERQAEDNVLHRLETAGLLAPDGAVNKVLETVINNLEITNNLDLQPPVRARVLLTTPIESFTVGHTIVLSRGFIDVLPDEASLALALAHELAHIALGHQLDTKYAFNDRTLFHDEEAFMHLVLRRTPSEEMAADKTGIEYLKNSPYKDKLSNAALFLRALDDRARELPNLVRPHLGDQTASNGKVKRMTDLIPQAPQLEMKRTDQIAALPLGSRIRVDSWSNNIELIKAKNVAPQFPREKMPFELAPIFLYLTRQQKPTDATAQTR